MNVDGKWLKRRDTWDYTITAVLVLAAIALLVATGCSQVAPQQQSYPIEQRPTVVSGQEQAAADVRFVALNGPTAANVEALADGQLPAVGVAEQIAAGPGGSQAAGLRGTFVQVFSASWSSGASSATQTPGIGSTAATPSGGAMQSSPRIDPTTTIAIDPRMIEAVAASLAQALAARSGPSSPFTPPPATQPAP